MKVLLVFLVCIAVAAAQVPPPKPAPPKPKPQPTEPPPLGPDPCDKKKCKGVGEECRRSKSNPKVAECVCIESCNGRELPDPLCTNTQATFNSICDFNKAQCACKKKPCAKKPGDYIVYYAECSKTYCNKNAEMKEYPRRVSQWLRDTHAARSMLPADTKSEQGELMNPLKKKDRRISANMYNDPNGNAIYVSWWFCDLDIDNNGSLDKKEVAALTRAMLPNEQCFQTFLSGCDGDSNGKISNTEWHGTSCFKVTKGKKSCNDFNSLGS